MSISCCIVLYNVVMMHQFSDRSNDTGDSDIETLQGRGGIEHSELLAFAIKQKLLVGL